MGLKGRSGMWALMMLIVLGQSNPDRAVEIKSCVDKVEQAEAIKEGSEKAPDLIQPAVEGAIGAATDIRNKLEGNQQTSDGKPRERKKAVESPKAPRGGGDDSGRRVRSDTRPGTASSNTKK
jgi:hypothetical protein